jgi:undecaprenyl-phosphate 4-deoxy-4-formamido-L-arabinose transferase
MKISVVIPCYRSQATLPTVVRETVDVLKQRPEFEYEIILVNDGSPDDTFGVIAELCRNDVNVKGINLSRNFGQACASMAGFAHATGDIIVYSDDDGQTPIDFLWALIDKLLEGYDSVFARFAQKKNSWFQNLGTKVNNLMANLLIGKPKHLHFGNFWVCRRFLIDEALKCKNPYPYIGGLFVKTTHNMTEVPTNHRERLHGTTNYNFAKMLSLWLNGFTAFSVMPLRVATFSGLVFSLAGFAFALYIIVQKIRYPMIPAGYSSLMATLVFIGGMIMFMLGLIGEYVGRIYININQIPQYVVRETINTVD